MYTIERNGESELEQKLLTPANWDNGIKTNIVVVTVVIRMGIGMDANGIVNIFSSCLDVFS